MQTITKLESNDLLNSIDVLGDKEDNFISRGNKIIKDIEQETKHLKESLRTEIEENKLWFCDHIEETISKLASLEVNSYKNEAIDNLPIC